MGTTKTSQTFGQKLRKELDSRGMGIRTLARTVVDKEPAAENRDRRVDNVRRQIREYLNGVTPTPRSRHIFEDALELDRDALQGDDEDASRMARPLTIRVPFEIDLPVELLARALEQHTAAALLTPELQES
jgi:hypothetical protein